MPNKKPPLPSWGHMAPKPPTHGWCPPPPPKHDDCDPHHHRPLKKHHSQHHHGHC